MSGKNIILFLMLLLTGLKPAFGQTYGDVEIHQITPHSEESCHGYYDFRLLIKNQSDRKAHQVSFSFVPYQLDTTGDIQKLSRSVALQPSASVVISIFQPALFMRAAPLVDIDGDVQKERLDVAQVEHHPSYGTNSNICILLAGSQNRDSWLNNIKNAGIPIKDRYNNDHFVFIRSDAEVADWSPHWLSYSRYDAVILTPQEYENAPVSIKSALSAYLNCGGTLILTGGRSETDNRFIGQEHPASELVAYFYGFGTLISILSPDIDSVQAPAFNYINNAWHQTQRPFVKPPGTVQANNSFPVIATLEVNTRFFFITMIVFVLVVGPINFFIFSKKNRKIWMWLSIPAISFSACFLIFAYVVVSEGFDSYLKLYGFTVLDERTHAAATLGVAAYYANLTPGEGLHFSTNTELTPLISNRYNSGGFRSIDWTKDQHLTSGWLTARIPTLFLARKHESRRERLEFDFDDAKAPAVLNGIGAAIKSLYVADAEGNIYTAQNILEGAKAALNPTEWQIMHDAPGKKLRLRYNAFKPNRRFAERRHPQGQFTYHDLLVKSTYIAELAGSPFLERGLNNADHQQMEATVFGIMSKKVD